MRVNPDQGLQFAQMLIQDEEPLANINQVAQTHQKRHSPETDDGVDIHAATFCTTAPALTVTLANVGASICVIPDVPAMQRIH